MINLELTEQECAQFKLFQQYHTKFEILLDAGIFTIHQGSVDIHFDKQGNIGAVDIHHNTYRRRATDS